MTSIRRLGGIFFLFFIINYSSLTASDPFQELKFKAYKSEKFEYDISYQIKKSLFKDTPTIEIFTQLSGPKIDETNTCFLSFSRDLLYIYQRSINHYENLDYIWEIENTGDKKKILYDDLRRRRTYSNPLTIPPQGFPVQALIYLFQDEALDVKQDLFYRLLVPPDIFFDVYGKIIGSETIIFQNKSVDCYKLDLATRGFFNLFAPRILYWVSKEKPHLPLKYTNGEFSVILVNAQTKPEEF